MESKDLLSVFAIALSVLTFFHNRKNNRSKVLFDIIIESRNEKFNAARTLLGEVFHAKQEVKFPQFREYSLFLNHVGLLVEKGYVDVVELHQVLGGSILFAWKVLGPSIVERRKQVDGFKYYQYHFQYLVSRILECQSKTDEEIESLIHESNQKILFYSKVRSQEHK